MKNTAIVKIKSRRGIPRKRLAKRLDSEQLMRRIIAQPQNASTEMQTQRASARKDDYLLEIERVIVFVAVASKDRSRPSHPD